VVGADGVKYRTIVADPPWLYRKQPGANGRFAPGAAENHYPTMTLEAIAGLPMRDLAAPEAHLFMWTTNVILTEQRTAGWSANDVVRAWGFEPKTLITWLKPQSMGWFFKGATEHVIYATRGSAGIPSELREPNYFVAPRSAHSAKPDCFYDMVERVTPGPYVEAFARRARFGWDYWGDQSLGTAELSA
jgi:N6-adenosine-specific RNA methylase IME4